MASLDRCIVCACCGFRPGSGRLAAIRGIPQGNLTSWIIRFTGTSGLMCLGISVSWADSLICLSSSPPENVLSSQAVLVGAAADSLTLLHAVRTCVAASARNAFAQPASWPQLRLLLWQLSSMDGWRICARRMPSAHYPCGSPPKHPE